MTKQPDKTVAAEPPDPESLLTVKQAAAHLGISFKALYDIIEKRKIAHYRLGVSGGAIRLKKSDLDDYLADCRQPVTGGAESFLVVEQRKRRRRVRSLVGLPRLGHCLTGSCPGTIKPTAKKKRG